MTVSNGRRPTRRDATMRYIDRQNLWEPVALQCGVSPHAVRCWKRVPKHCVVDVERATGRPARLIRPDIYPRSRSA